MKLWKRVCLIAYCLLSALIIDMLSYLDYEEMIGEGEIATVCDVLRSLVVDDTRDATAPLTSLLLLPICYLAFKRKIKSWSLNIAAISLTLFWVWRFFLRFSACT